MLEHVLRAQQLPHHVLVYHADGEWRGRFCHRTPDGRLRVIERPDNLLTLEPGLVLVKLNGGAVPGLVRGYVSTAVDDVQLAARIPHVLPAYGSVFSATRSENTTSSSAPPLTEAAPSAGQVTPKNRSTCAASALRVSVCEACASARACSTSP